MAGIIAFPFLDQPFVERHMPGDGVGLDADHRPTLISVEQVGEATGLASCLAKIDVEYRCPDNCGAHSERRYVITCVVKSFSNIKISAETRMEQDKSSLKSRESNFYRDLSVKVAPEYVYIPRLYGVSSCVDDNGKATERLILEFLGAPWQLGNQLEGLSEREIKAALASLASLHSYPLPSSKNLPSWLVDVDAAGSGYFSDLAPLIRTSVRQLFPAQSSPSNKSSTEEMERKIQSVVSDISCMETAIDVFREIGEHWSHIVPALHAINAERRLIHMDARGENMFFRPSLLASESTETLDVMLIDWQNVSLGSPALDLAYLLAGSLTVAQRRDLEDSLLKFYIQERIANQARLEVRGISCPAPPTAAVFRVQYEVSCLWPVVWALLCCAEGIQGVERLLDVCNKWESSSRARASKFMRLTAQRYLQCAIDHQSGRTAFWTD